MPLTSSPFYWAQIPYLIIKHLQGSWGDMGWRIPSAGKGFMPFHKKCPNRWKMSQPLKNDPAAKNDQPFWEICRTFFVEGHEALPCTDIRLFTQSRRAYWAAEIIRVRGWDRREAFGLMRREQRDLRSMWRGWGDIEVEEIVREQCWCISVNSPQVRRSLCVL